MKKKDPVTEKDLSLNAYRQAFGVVVLCEDELHQIQVYEHLKKQGFRLKVAV